MRNRARIVMALSFQWAPSADIHDKFLLIPPNDISRHCFEMKINQRIPHAHFCNHIIPFIVPDVYD